MKIGSGQEKSEKKIENHRTLLSALSAKQPKGGRKKGAKISHSSLTVFKLRLGAFIPRSVGLSVHPKNYKTLQTLTKPLNT